MPPLIFATNNQHKVNEIRAVLPASFQIITLKEAGINIDIPEPHDTLEANALEKSSVIYKLTGLDCFSEDTGLEVAALNGAPGVHSARYAGEGRDFAANIEKLLQQLGDNPNRGARFRTVVSLLLGGKQYFFEGVCEGQILHESLGSGGFGYDPVFMPNGASRSFAEMEMSEKNKFSHRKKAIEQLSLFLHGHHQ
jgi:XTP/dITP diphosphohydrolase